MLLSLQKNIRAFGWRGCMVSLFSKVSRLTGWHARVRVPFAVNGRQGVVRLRVRTSDMAVYADVFTHHQLRVDVPHPPRLIIDAGAYIGLSSIYFAETWPAATVVAVEPDPENFELLRLNVAPYSNVVPVHAALWDRATQLNVVASPTGYWGSRTVADAAGADARGRVEAVTVEALIEQVAAGDRVDILKLDIEGAEKEVLEACGPWIDRVGTMIVELHERKRAGCGEALRKASVGFGRVHRSGEKVICQREIEAAEPAA